jgi:hypothetical protein
MRGAGTTRGVRGRRRAQVGGDIRVCTRSRVAESVLRQYRREHVPVDIGESERPTIVFVGKLRVVDS